MKQIQTWKDENRNITNNIYQFDSGVRLVESINPGSIETYVSFLFGGGYIYENKLGLTKGTLHFLEHIMAGNPNNFLKDKKSINEFTHGGLNFPKLFVNAFTSRQFVKFVGYSHYSGLVRLLKFLTAEINYPLNRVEEFIEKERSIILAEYLRKERKEDSLAIAYEEFLFGDLYDFVSEHGIGTEDSIKAITVEDLIKCYNEIINANNLVIAIQHPKKLTKVELKIIENFVNKLPSGKQIQFKPKKYINRFKYKAFKKAENRGIFMSINRFYPERKDINYTESVLDFFYKRLINNLTFEKLREEKNLIYEGGAGIDFRGLDLKNYSFSVNVTKEKFADLLEETYKLFEVGIEQFLVSEESDKWFESEKSMYIYRLNQNYNAVYAEDIGIYIHCDEDPVYHFSQAVEIAKSLKKETLLAFYKKIISVTPAFWFVSPYELTEVTEVFENSSLYKKYK